MELFASSISGVEKSFNFLLLVTYLVEILLSCQHHVDIFFFFLNFFISYKITLTNVCLLKQHFTIFGFFFFLSLKTYEFVKVLYKVIDPNYKYRLIHVIWSEQRQNENKKKVQLTKTLKYFCFWTNTLQKKKRKKSRQKTFVLHFVFTSITNKHAYISRTVWVSIYLPY